MLHMYIYRISTVYRPPLHSLGSAPHLPVKTPTTRRWWTQWTKNTCIVYCTVRYSIPWIQSWIVNHRLLSPFSCIRNYTITITIHSRVPSHNLLPPFLAFVWKPYSSKVTCSIICNRRACAPSSPLIAIQCSLTEAGTYSLVVENY